MYSFLFHSPVEVSAEGGGGIFINLYNGVLDTVSASIGLGLFKTY